MTPTTAAGDKMLYDMGLDDPIIGKHRRDTAIRRILAIETEAAAAERARLRAAVEGLPNLSPFPTDWPYVQRADVLALLREPVA
jgi:hypothetical protein